MRWLLIKGEDDEIRGLRELRMFLSLKIWQKKLLQWKTWILLLEGEIDRATATGRRWLGAPPVAAILSENEDLRRSIGVSECSLSVSVESVKCKVILFLGCHWVLIVWLIVFYLTLQVTIRRFSNTVFSTTPLPHLSILGVFVHWTSWHCGYLIWLKKLYR